MLNQQPPDTVRSASYVENYLDCVENLPEDVQRYLSRLHELDVTYRNYVKDAENFKEALQKEDLEIHMQRKTLFKLEQVLMSLQEVGDEKVEIGQLILDLIDNKYRALDLELRELGAADSHKEDDSVESSGAGSGGGKETTASTGGAGGGGGGGGASSGGGGRSSEVAVTPAPSQSSSERAKRSRRGGRGDEGPPTTPTPSLTPDPPEVQRNKRQAGNNAKKKKRKSRASNSARDDSPPREEDIITPVPADIDEPTYCLCDQISYGEMILCDNDLCPIEWFHFVCVSLTTKPKGKWFCPKCRGDRPNVMKPKSQFLKELERYNKEKEEKS